MTDVRSYDNHEVWARTQDGVGGTKYSITRRVGLNRTTGSVSVASWTAGPRGGTTTNGAAGFTVDEWAEVSATVDAAMESRFRLELPMPLGLDLEDPAVTRDAAGNFWLEVENPDGEPMRMLTGGDSAVLARLRAKLEAFLLDYEDDDEERARLAAQITEDPGWPKGEA